MSKKQKKDRGGASTTLGASQQLPVSFTVNTIHATGTEMLFKNAHAVTWENETVPFKFPSLLWDWSVDVNSGVLAIEGNGSGVQ